MDVFFADGASYFAFYVKNGSVVHNNYSSGSTDTYIYNSSFAIYPVFYLNSDVSVISGSGTSLNPYKIK